MRVPDLEDIIAEAEKEASSLKHLVEEWYDMDTEQWYDLKGKLIGDTPLPVVPLPKVTYPAPPSNPQGHLVPVIGTSGYVLRSTDSSNPHWLSAPSLDAPVVSLTLSSVYLT